MKETRVKMKKPVYLGLSISEIRTKLMYEFCYDYIKPKYQQMQNYITWTQIVSSVISKVKSFIKTLQMMLKKDLIHEIMKLIDHCLQEKMKT